MTLQELIVRFRAQVQDEDVPYLWSEDEALDFAIDAQDMYFRLTGGISDMTVAAGDVGSPPTRLPDLVLTAGEPYAAIHPRIVRVRSARLVTQKQDVTFVSEGDLGTVAIRDYGWARGLSLDDTDTGDVRYGVLDIRENFVRWMRVPDTDDTCRLHIYRLPYPRPTSDEAELLVPEHHQLHLTKWMKHLAYAKEDAETYDKDLSAANEAAFERYCARAKSERTRLHHKTRVVKYGGL